MQEHLIIIGGVAAGPKAAAKARREDPSLKITLYSDEKNISYSACGIPYFVEDLIKDSNKLIVRTPQQFKEQENIDIYTQHKVLEILPKKNKVVVRNLTTGEIFEDEYTKLLIATGAKPFIPPIEGVELEGIFTVRNIEDAINIKEQLKSAKKAIVIGGGYIGMEMFGALSARGLDTTVIEMAPHIYSVLDEDMVQHVEKFLKEEKKAKIITGDGVKRFIGKDRKIIKVETISGKEIYTDIMIFSIGVRPNIELARNVGIKIGETGAIKVNSYMQTSIDNIYAAGDCVEQIHIVTQKPVWIPLGSTANKQGRTAAINITGGSVEFNGVLGSSVTKIFDYTVSKTGLGEKEARKANIEYEIAIVPHKDKSGYMPEAKEIIIKMLADKTSGKIIGAQVVGKGDCDKRINVIVAAITSSMSVSDFLNSDLTYSPPYSPSIDPLLTAAQILQSKLGKQSESISLQEAENLDKEEFCILHADAMREKLKELCQTVKEGTVKLDELEKQGFVVFSKSGRQSHIICKQLKKLGVKNVRFVDGGSSFLKSSSEKSKS